MSNLIRKDNLLLVRLEGTEEQQVEQHFSLLKDEIRTGALSFLKDKTWKTVDKNALLPAPIKKAAIASLKAMSSIGILKRFSITDKRKIEIIASAAGISYSDARQAFIQADSFNHIAGFGSNFGCTTVVAHSDRTVSGNILVGRNFDYPVTGYWEKHPAVFFIKPDKGLKHVSITSAGIHAPGLTAMNEKQLVMSLHYHACRLLPHRGHHFLYTANKIIAGAESIDSAIDIAKNNMPAGSWSMIITSGRENRSITLEISNGRLAVIESDGDINSRTNTFSDDKLARYEINPINSFLADSDARRSQALKMIREFGKVDPQKMANVLGSHLDPLSGKQRPTGNTISVATTVNSVVFDPCDYSMYIANSLDTPVSLGEYVKVPFWPDFNEIGSTELVKLSPPEFYNTPRREALVHHASAFVSYYSKSDTHETIANLTKAHKADEQDGAYPLMIGMLYVSINKPESALEFLDKASALTLDDYKKVLNTFFIARSLDLMNKRDDAVKNYQDICSSDISPEFMKKLSRKHIKTPFAQKDCKRISIDLQYHDCIVF